MLYFWQYRIRRVLRDAFCERTSRVRELGKKASGNLLDGRQHLEIPGINFFPTQEAA